MNIGYIKLFVVGVGFGVGSSLFDFLVLVNYLSFPCRMYQLWLRGVKMCSSHYSMW